MHAQQRENHVDLWQEWQNTLNRLSYRNIFMVRFEDLHLMRKVCHLSKNQRASWQLKDWRWRCQNKREKNEGILKYILRISRVESRYKGYQRVPREIYSTYFGIGGIGMVIKLLSWGSSIIKTGGQWPNVKVLYYNYQLAIYKMIFYLIPISFDNVSVYNVKTISWYFWCQSRIFEENFVGK